MHKELDASIQSLGRDKLRRSLRQRIFKRITRLSRISCLCGGGAFGVDRSNHDILIRETQNNKPASVVLHVTVTETKELPTSQQHGSQDSFFILGSVVSKSKTSSPRSTPILHKKSNPDVNNEVKQTHCVKGVARETLKWNETFHLDVKDLQTQDVQIFLFHKTEKADNEIKKHGLKAFFKSVRAFTERERNNYGCIDQCYIPLKGIPAVGQEDWFTLVDNKKVSSAGKVKVKLELGIKKTDDSDVVDSDRCTIEEFHYVVKAMYRYAIKTAAENPKNMEGQKPVFTELPEQMKNILHQYATQNQFTKVSRSLVEAIVVMELSSDKYCPCVISEQLLKESVVGLEMDYQTAQYAVDDTATVARKPVLSNVEIAMFDKAATAYTTYLASSMKEDQHGAIPKLFPAKLINMEQLNKRISLAVTLLNMNVWDNNDRARRMTSNLLVEQIQDDVKTWVQEEFLYLNKTTENSHEPVIPDTTALVSIIQDAAKLLAPAHAISQHLLRLGVDYFKVASTEMERRLSTKSMEIMQELDRYQVRFNKYSTNIRESSGVSLRLYFELRNFFNTVRGNVGDRELFKIQISSYQLWFEHAVMFWLQTFREECIKRMEKALEIEKDPVQVTSLVKHSNSSVDVLSCFAKITSEWMEIDFTDADIAVLGCTKITDTICDGATQYAERIHSILENNGYYDFIDNAQFDVTDQLCITMNNIMHVRKYLHELPGLLNWDSVCQNLSVKHEDEEIGQKSLKVLEKLVVGADSDMMIRCRVMIQNIVDKMAVDMNRMTMKFTHKEHKKKASLDPLFVYLDANLEVLSEKLEPMIFPIILEEIWYTLLEILKENILTGENPEYYKHMVSHLHSIREYVLRGVNSETVDECQTYCELVQCLELNSMTTEQLVSMYYKDIVTDNTTPKQYFGRLTLKAGYKSESNDTVGIHCKVASAEDLPAVCSNNSSDPFVTVSLHPHTEITASSKLIQHTRVVDNSLSPHFNQEFYFKDIPKSDLQEAGHIITLTVWHHETVLPNDFLGEVTIAFNDLDSIDKVTSLDEITARMLPLRRPVEPISGPLFCLKQRQKRDKKAKELFRMRSVMAGWEYPVTFASPLAKVMGKAKGKKSHIEGQDYVLSQSYVYIT